MSAIDTVTAPAPEDYPANLMTAGERFVSACKEAGLVVSHQYSPEDGIEDDAYDADTLVGYVLFAGRWHRVVVGDQRTMRVDAVLPLADMCHVCGRFETASLGDAGEYDEWTCSGACQEYANAHPDLYDAPAGASGFPGPDVDEHGRIRAEDERPACLVCGELTRADTEVTCHSDVYPDGVPVCGDEHAAEHYQCLQAEITED